MRNSTLDLAARGPAEPAAATSAPPPCEKAAMAWPLFYGTFVVIAAAKVVGGFDATWVLLGLAVPFVGYGLSAAPRVPPTGCRCRRSRWPVSGRPQASP